MSLIRKLTPKNFPAALREIADPPTELYLEGELPPPETIYLTVVGSRKFSSYGREAVEKIISELAGHPITIVSGLAVGIDTIAHKAALAARLHTIAIPGSGLGRTVLHPSSNRILADEIVASGGALISEFPETYPAGLHTFPRRNRIMAGVAKGILVIEAGEKSGTLITAKLATEYNRDVYAVPGSIFNSGSVGTNNLIKQGATPVCNGRDLLIALGFEVPEDGQLKLALEGLNSDEQKVYDLLSVEPLARDELLRAIKLPISEGNVLLATLEIKGLIKEMLGEIRWN